MQLAFYAPMKPPDHPNPSGDRTIARNILAALRYAGADVALASHLRSRDGTGDTAAQDRLFAEAGQEIDRLTREGRTAGWRAWVTYHNYYKAPDLLGPAVATALNIPYVLIEASRARKRLSGPWARFAEAAEAASDTAQVIFYASERDGQTLRRDAPAQQTLIHLRPFLTEPLPPYSFVAAPEILIAGMMRPGDKLASYKIIAETLAMLADTKWHARIAGDGPSRSDVETLLPPERNRLTYLGLCDDTEMKSAFAQSAVFLWPGVNEALGMVYLEAQAAGCTVVAQDRPGMRELLAPGRYPAPNCGAAALADTLRKALADPDARRRRAVRLRDHITNHHLIDTAAATLRDGLARIGVPA